MPKIKRVCVFIRVAGKGGWCARVVEKKNEALVPNVLEKVLWLPGVRLLLYTKGRDSVSRTTHWHLQAPHRRSAAKPRRVARQALILRLAVETCRFLWVAQKPFEGRKG